VADVRLTAQLRTEFGKGFARRARRDGLIPAVIYGHGEAPRHVSLAAREFTAAVKKNGANVLITLAMPGGDQLAIPKSIVRNPLKGTYEHIDLLAVRRGEKVTIDVPITITGELIRGALLSHEHNSVSVDAEATHLPSEIIVDITDLEIGSQVKASDLVLPTGTVLAGDPDLVLLIIQESPTAADLEAGETPAEAAPAAAAEPASETE
jgi:large subunit ribosomal protein L25